MVLRNREMDMCNGPLFSKILIFSFPIMIMNILQLLFNAIGMIVVGRFSGSEARIAIHNSLSPKTSRLSTKRKGSTMNRKDALTVEERESNNVITTEAIEKASVIDGK
jgi:Na+-driven multidrug efflux pump